MAEGSRACDEGFVPFNIAVAPQSMSPNMREVWLEQARNLRGNEGELVARRQLVRISMDVLQKSERLREAMQKNTCEGGELYLSVNAEALSIEAVARALEWQAAGADEQRSLFGHSSWRSISNTMHAASWLGCAPLVAACESHLCAALELRNVRQCSCAPGRCAAFDDVANPAHTCARAIRLCPCRCRLCSWRRRRAAAMRPNFWRAPFSFSNLSSALTMTRWALQHALPACCQLPRQLP